MTEEPTESGPDDGRDHDRADPQTKPADDSSGDRSPTVHDQPGARGTERETPRELARDLILGGRGPDTDDVDQRRQAVATLGDAVVRASGFPTRWLRDRLDFANPKLEWRRLFAEFMGTFFLALVAVGAGMVNARFGGNVIPLAVAVTAPALMVGAIILSIGAVSGAHLNPGVSIAFAMRGDFPWKRVPGYIVVQMLGAMAAAALLILLLGSQGTAGLSEPGPGISPLTACLWEALLTVGLVSTILGSSSGAQNVGPLSAIAVTFYIALAGLWGAPVSGASMNTARSLGPAIVFGDLKYWWVYLVGPLAGAMIAVGLAYILRGPGGGYYGRKAADGSIGWLWDPGPIKGGHWLAADRESLGTTGPPDGPGSGPEPVAADGGRRSPDDRDGG